MKLFNLPISRLRLEVSFVFALLLTGCGGGGGGGGSGTSALPGGGSGTLTPMIDSLGRTIAESDFGGGDTGAAGADGSAGEGAPIANAPVLITDALGRTATGKTDASGYYRIRIEGFTAPIIARVTRADGSYWYSSTLNGPVARSFVTMNITGLTDKAVEYVAEAGNVAGGASAVTPALVASNSAALSDAKSRINAGLSAPLTYAGLDTSTFDPVSSPYAAVKGDKYDFLLDRLSMSKRTGGTTAVVGTIAGVKEPFVNGTGSGATFSAPQGAAMDSSGNVIIADQGNNAVRKISPTGVVSTLAGTGSSGATDGLSANASFKGPGAVATDSSGNVYVADVYNHSIRKISASGNVTTLAGNGTAGFRDGAASSATFNTPRDVTVDSLGNVYVADLGNNAIRKISSSGVVTTLAGNGTAGNANGIGSTARFNGPSSIAIDSVGNLYVGDQFNFSLRKIDTTGVVSTLAGSGSSGFADGIGTSAAFSALNAIAVDSANNLYVADGSNLAVRKVTPSGAVSTLNLTGVTLLAPVGVAVTSAGQIYIVDSSEVIFKHEPSVGTSAFAGTTYNGFTDGVGNSARFRYPSGISIDSAGNTYVADSWNNAIRRVTRTGVVTTYAGTGASGFSNGPKASATFNNPTDVVVDGSNNVYVADSGNHAIRKIAADGTVSTVAGNGSAGFVNGIGTAASFNSPLGLALDGTGALLVADSSNSALRKVAVGGSVTTVIGNGSCGFKDGTIAVAQMCGPQAMTVDAAGNVYVADFANHAIRRLSPAGVLSTLAGTGSSGFVDGIGTSASFNGPAALAVDSKGNIYIAESGNSVVRKLDPSGAVSRVAGSGSGGYKNGSGPASAFNAPHGIAISPSGSVVVSDSLNAAIRVVLP